MVEENHNNTNNPSIDEVENSSETEQTEVQIDSESVVEPEEIKQLEEKEHYELEYFSKEECLENIKNLEEQIAEFKEKTQKLQKATDESKNKYMHLQAEFENAQKRWNKSRQDLRTQYTASALKNFLPLYDSFKKALESGNETEKNTLKGFYDQFMSIFKSYGAEPIEVKVNDLFDYSNHEALTSIEKEDVPENTILEIVQDGFKYGKEVIRYTKVIVSRKPKPPEPEPEPIEEIELAENVQIEESSLKEEGAETEKERKKVKEKKDKKEKKEKKDKN
jgi:molecular chaperone GrpE